MIKPGVKFKFGNKLRLVRERKGITLKVVGAQAGVSESLVSQIERNRVSPSIDTLLNIADVLEIDPEYLFKDFKQNKNVSIIRAFERSSLVENDITYYKLSSMNDDSESQSFEIFLLEISVHAEKGDIEYGHQGKEWGIIIEGNCELIYGTESYFLNEGDSVSLSSKIPHILKNAGNKILKTIWAVTPSRKLFS